MRSLELDARDYAILRELMRDGRLSNVTLAERVGLSPSACLRRVKLMEESGLIAGYVMRWVSTVPVTGLFKAKPVPVAVTPAATVAASVVADAAVQP